MGATDLRSRVVACAPQGWIQLCVPEIGYMAFSREASYAPASAVTSSCLAPPAPGAQVTASALEAPLSAAVPGLEDRSQNNPCPI